MKKLCCCFSKSSPLTSESKTSSNNDNNASVVFTHLLGIVNHGYSLTWCKSIFAYLGPTAKDTVKLRSYCKLFSKALKPLPKGSWTSFPHPKYSTLNKLFGRFNELSSSGSTNLPKVLLIENGIHTIEDEYDEDYEKEINTVTINIPISIIGESREHCIVIGGLKIDRKKEHDELSKLYHQWKRSGKTLAMEKDDVNVSDLTLRGSKGNGVFGYRGACIHLDNVSVEYSEHYGVVVCCNVSSTYRNCNTMKNCNVSRSKGSGLVVGTGALLWYDGTTVHHNFTDEDSAHYGVHTSTGRMIDTHGGGRYLIPSVNDTIINDTYGLGNDTDSLTVGCGIYISPSGDNNRYIKLSSVGGTGHAGQWYT
jgi:hypothetical protein